MKERILDILGLLALCVLVYAAMVATAIYGG
jgi:hypothetical protein